MPQPNNIPPVSEEVGLVELYERFNNGEFDQPPEHTPMAPYGRVLDSNQEPRDERRILRRFVEGCVGVAAVGGAVLWTGSQSEFYGHEAVSTVGGVMLLGGMALGAVAAMYGCAPEEGRKQ